MAIFKCKVCGGDLNVNDDAIVAECEYCGTKQMLPRVETEAEPTVVIKETVVAADNASTTTFLKRAFMSLEDGEWEKADQFCEQALNIDPECAEAYLGKMMAELRARTQEDLKNCDVPLDYNRNYPKIIRFGDEKLKATLDSYIEHILDRIIKENYDDGKARMERANTENAYFFAARAFEAAGEYKDAPALAKECREKAEAARKDKIYADAKSQMPDGTMGSYQHQIDGYEVTIELFKPISGWRDVDEQISICQKKIEEIKARIETERKDGIYWSAKSRMTGSDISEYDYAIKLFRSIPGWKDADELIPVCQKKIEEIKARKEAARAQYLKEERRAKTTKKIAIIAAVVICIAIVFACVRGVVISIRTPSFEFDPATGTVLGTKDIIPPSEVVIPPEIKGVRVTNIGDQAFDYDRSMTSVTIPDSVTNIGKNAFYACSGLTSITIPNSVTSIGEKAFQGCSKLTSVTIGNGVTSIGDQAFYACEGLTSVTIPDSVTSIGTCAFYGCSGLTSVTIGNGVTSIGDQAFYGCSGLQTVYFQSATQKNKFAHLFQSNVQLIVQ